MVIERNVLGGDLVPCSSDPRAGHRSCHAEHGRGRAVCATMTQEFLRHQRSVGNDLTRRDEVARFPGLRPGESWCVDVDLWLASREAGAAAPVWLAGTSERALEAVTLEALREHAVDVPPDPGRLLA